MTVLSPIWLLGLLPWAALVVYAHIGRRRGVAVPFLALWEGPVAAPRAARARLIPPMFVYAILLSALLALLAAAGPALRGGQGKGCTITIILDRGVTMSPSIGGEPFRGVAPRADRELKRRAGSAQVELVEVPGRALRTSETAWTMVAHADPPTALDTQQQLEATVAERLRSTNGPVVVLSDRTLSTDDERIVQIPPAAGVRDVGVDWVGARAMPTPQVMVRLRNTSAATEAKITVASGEGAMEKLIPLPANGQTRDYFIDVPSGLAESVRVEVRAKDIVDEAAVDDRAWLVREQAWPVVEPRSVLPPAVTRMIETYAKLRPSTSRSKHVAVAAGSLAASQVGLKIIEATGAANVGDVNVTASPHPITVNVGHWPAPAEPMTQLPSGFRSIVATGQSPLVAIREGPVRQAWINLDLERWSRDPDFVVFFANLFGWLGEAEGSGKYVAHSPAQIGLEWVRVDDSPAPQGTAGLWPGLYRRDDGTLRAVNAPAVEWGSPPVVDWQGRLDRALMSGGIGLSSLRPWLATGAVVAGWLAVVLAARWPRRNRKTVAAQDGAIDAVSTRVVEQESSLGA